MSTRIEWCDETFNPWHGCEKVSPGCAHCYAEGQARRFAGGLQLWGAGHDFKFFGDAHWDAPLLWARTLPAKLGRRPRIFCASMADVFEERRELDQHRLRLFELIHATPELDWLLLTKRPEFARDWLAGDSGGFQILTANVWMGVSIENARFTWRADVLREIPAAVWFISAEPLLGSLFADRNDRTAAQPSRSRDVSVDNLSTRGRAPLDLTGIDWVIAGGESGPGCRPCDPAWIRELLYACLEPRCDCSPGDCCECRRPAFFLKQLGGHPDKRGHDRAVLDGRRWLEFPASAAVPA